MPLSGEYEASPWRWLGDYADKIMDTRSIEGIEMKDKPLILLTTIGAKTG